MLDLIRHMAKAYQDSLIQCDELVRLILQNVGTYTNNESAEKNFSSCGLTEGPTFLERVRLFGVPRTNSNPIPSW